MEAKMAKLEVSVKSFLDGKFQKVYELQKHNLIEIGTDQGPVFRVFIHMTESGQPIIQIAAVGNLGAGIAVHPKASNTVEILEAG